MNPPYKGNMHLKILSKMVEVFPNAEIVNLSPVAWMQDILAEKKKGTSFQRYLNTICPQISDLEAISVKDANKLFDLEFRGDLGLYYLTGEGGFDLEKFRYNTKEKVLARKLSYLFENIISTYPEMGYTYNMDYSKDFKFTFPAAGHPAKRDWGWLCSGTRAIAYDYRGENLNKKYIKLSFNTEAERNNFYDFLFSNFVQFFVRNARRSVDVPPILQFIPYLEDFTEPWTDSRLYEYFNLTDEEIKIIEDFASQNLK